MKAASITGPGAIEIIDQPAPRAFGDIVVVKVLVAPMCTEYKDRQAGLLTDVVGHEAAGVVVDAGTSSRVRVGDRVAVMPGYACGKCRYCTAGEHIHCPFGRDVLTESDQPSGLATYAEYILKPDWLLLPLPADISLDDAAAACCLLGPTFNASQRMRVSATDTVLVAGAGPVGLGGIINSVGRGARAFSLEVQPFRKALAESLGATVFDPSQENVHEKIREATEGWGVSASIETSGVTTNPRLLAELSARRAQLSIVAWGLDIALPPVVPLGLDIHGCWHWNHQVDGFRMLDLIRRSRPLLDKAVTHRFALDDVADAMDLQDTGLCGKVYLYPHGLENA